MNIKQLCGLLCTWRANINICVHAGVSGLGHAVGKRSRCQAGSPSTHRRAAGATWTWRFRGAGQQLPPSCRLKRTRTRVHHHLLCLDFVLLWGWAGGGCCRGQWKLSQSKMGLVTKPRISVTHLTLSSAPGTSTGNILIQSQG